MVVYNSTRSRLEPISSVSKGSFSLSLSLSLVFFSTRGNKQYNRITTHRTKKLHNNNNKRGTGYIQSNNRMYLISLWSYNKINKFFYKHINISIMFNWKEIRSSVFSSVRPLKWPFYLYQERNFRQLMMN